MWSSVTKARSLITNIQATNGYIATFATQVKFNRLLKNRTLLLHIQHYAEKTAYYRNPGSRFNPAFTLTRIVVGKRVGGRRIRNVILTPDIIQSIQ